MLKEFILGYGFLIMIMTPFRDSIYEGIDPKNPIDLVEGFVDGFISQNNLTEFQKCSVDLARFINASKPIIDDFKNNQT